MTTITFRDHTYDCNNDESVLACLTRHGEELPSSCQSGVCQTCMMRATAGAIPESAQQGLKPTQRSQGYFLACVCTPTENMTVESAESLNQFTGVVCEKSHLNEDILRIRITKPESFHYRAGQFINLIRDGGALIRSYSLASIADEELELHIKVIPNGAMSSWIADSLHVGDSITFQGPSGDCFYLDNKPEQSILMVGISTGLAPLYGIARDALAQGHRGEINIYHASLAAAGLYYCDEMHALAATHDNVNYTPCVLNGPAPDGGRVG
ncbi:MAG: 2Fe-2S iron-sulfur cluster binding domain-containing protein, partial [Mariprofundales bacterium]|nr:2Fe-2S iron-sulfur cluster binding domain-containing protein [Mariprofundales bacterium]